mgnify:CR=1 FL=1
MLEIGGEGRLLDPPVEPEDLGAVFVDQLDTAGQPVVQKGLVGLRVFGHGGAVEAGVARVANVGVEASAGMEEPPVLGPMAGEAEDQPPRPDGLGQVADDIAPGPHADGVPLREAAVVHGEAVVVLGHRHLVAGAGLLEEGRPPIGIKSFTPEEGNEVLVAELRLGTVGGPVVGELARAGPVHVARVPLVAKGGNGVDAPVDEDAELGVEVPLGNGVALQRLPGRRKGARGYDKPGLRCAHQTLLRRRECGGLTARSMLPQGPGLGNPFRPRPPRSGAPGQPGGGRSPGGAGRTSGGRVAGCRRRPGGSRR